MDNILEITNLCKKYKDFSLDNLNLTLPYGSIMGFIGENGAGKSTTIKLILDIVKKDSGTIKLFGEENISSNKALKEDIGVVLDESCFPDNLNIIYIQKIMSSIYKNWEKETFEKYYTKFSLPEKKIAKDFSRGMKMKLAIAVALSHRPKLLILDEATSGLDPVVRDEILDVFYEFIQDERHSIIISSHIISDLEKICDYIAFIHKGKLIFNKSKDAILDEYGLLKCSEEELKTVDKNSIINVKKNAFGVEALVYKEKVPKTFIVDNAKIEDVMLHNIR